MNIGMVCYASVGGSGIVATELAKALAAGGHDVHVISSETPVRLGAYQEGLSFHRVETPSYPLFRQPQYLLSLATRIVQLSRQFSLDLVHAHYAIPHATAAYLARQILQATHPGSVPRVITTLHGTDITLVGSDQSYAETVAFSIGQSDGVTAVSNSLRADTRQTLGITRHIEVIPNFLDCTIHRRGDYPSLRQRLTDDGRVDRLIAHVSNLRPVKRVDAVLQIFARVRRRIPSRLIVVGDGPDLGRATSLARELGIENDVEIMGEQEQVLPILSVSDVFLLPSAQESFGLAALEAMACEVPVVASNVGGLPEVILDGATGFLHDPADLEAMAASVLALFEDEGRRRRMGRAACEHVREHFCAERIVPRYVNYYEEVLGRRLVRRVHRS